jgi:hypothetical protein
MRRRDVLRESLSELKDDLVLSHHAELSPRDSLDSGGIVTELAHFHAQPLYLAVAVRVLRGDLVELFLERAQPRKPLGLEHENRNGHKRQAEHPDRESAFEDVCGTRHGALASLPCRAATVPLLTMGWLHRGVKSPTSARPFGNLASVTLALARALILAEAVTPAVLAEALFLSATRHTSLVRALLATRAIDAIHLEQALERVDAPYVQHVTPVMALVERLPPTLCDRLLAIPVGYDPRMKVVDVAVVDVLDPHPAEEIGYWLEAPVRTVRTSVASMESALLRVVGRIVAEVEPGLRTLAPPIWVPPPRPADAQAVPTATSAPRVFDDPSGDEIAIPLTRRHSSAERIIALGPETIRRAKRETDPIVDLKQRRPVAREVDDPLRSPVETLRGPFAPRMAAPSPDEIVSVVKQMNEVRDRDRILELLVAGVRLVARRVAVLAVRRDALVGWTGSPELAGPSALRGVRLANTMRTVLHDALGRDGARLAQMPIDAAHAPLLSVMAFPPSGPIALAAVQTEGRSVAVVFADQLDDVEVAVERIAYFARAAGESLGRLLRERR